MSRGYEVRTVSDKGEGVFALRDYQALETVMLGVIERRTQKNHSHASQISENGFAFHAGDIRMVNHSCDPNCGISVNAGGGHDFIAMRPIAPGEEIVFDYAMRNHRVDYFAVACACGSKFCRGVISGWRHLPESVKDRYAGFVAPYLLELDGEKAAKTRVGLREVNLG